MKLNFKNLDARYAQGMSDFLKWHKIEQAADGLTIEINITDTDKLTISKNGNSVIFDLGKEYQVFRAVTLLKGRAAEENFVYSENVYFDTCGAMFDGSQANSLMNVKSAKKMMLILAGMGYNTLMLYCEDCYEVEGEPYWGNMRPRYSKAELKDLDDYAYSLGLELIPCIQTLGHLVEAIKKPPYHKIADTDTVLLVGEDAVYTLIDKLIATAAECFRSRRIHIGMDEAWNLGLGNYLNKNGYTKPYDIMTEHLTRVAEITRKYSFRPMMWNDMFFRSCAENNWYYQDETFNFPDNIIKSVPEDFDLIYWDYYQDTPDKYLNMMRLSKQLCDNMIFAGCVRNVFTFAGCYSKTETTTNAALTACKTAGVRETIATVWGDNQSESSNLAILPGLQLYAEHMYAEVPDINAVKRRLYESANADWDDFMDIDALDDFEGHKTDKVWDYSLTRACMWQDILLGMYDYNLGDADYAGHFGGLKVKLKSHIEKYPEYKYLFDFYYRLADALENKASAGVKLAAAYKAGDKAELKRFAEELLPEISQKVQALRLSHREYFFTEYKPIGWEILDIRYGGAIMRIDTAIKRINDYLEGSLDRIEELEEERLPYCQDGHPVKIFYQSVCSASSL